MVCVVGGDERGDVDGACVHLDDPEPKAPLLQPGKRCHLPGCVLDGGQDPRGQRSQGLSGRRQTHGSGGAKEQRNPELGLQPGDLLAER